MDVVKEEIKEEQLLTGLINVSTLQKMQNTFSVMTGMASVIVDSNKSVIG